MPPISRDLALTPDQLDELMTTSWNLRIATVGPGERINLTPLWFGWAGDAISAFCRGQKVVNLRRTPHVTVLVDRNERFPELQGSMFPGRGTVLEDAAAEEADEHLEEIRLQMGAKYAGGHGRPAVPPPGGEVPRNTSTARGRAGRWIRVDVDRMVTWDNFKLTPGARG